MLHILLHAIGTGVVATMNEQLLQALEEKIDELVERCEALHAENRELRSKQSAWQDESVRLREKNELARSRVDHMISRLKTLEQES